MYEPGPTPLSPGWIVISWDCRGGSAWITVVVEVVGPELLSSGRWLFKGRLRSEEVVDLIGGDCLGRFGVCCFGAGLWNVLVGPGVAIRGDFLPGSLDWIRHGACSYCIDGVKGEMVGDRSLGSA